MCCVLYAVLCYRVLCAVCCALFAVCCVLCAVWCVLCAVCCVLCAVCCVLCCVLCALQAKRLEALQLMAPGDGGAALAKANAAVPGSGKNGGTRVSGQRGGQC
jgi:hypothetical protein